MAPSKNYRKRHIYKLEITEMPCLFCGICCSKFQPQISISEAKIIAAKLGVSFECFLEECCDSRWPGTRNSLLRRINGACVFLHPSEDRQKKLCLIHAFKPSCCVEWKQGKDRPECLEGLKTYWDLTTDSSGNVCGTRSKIQALKRFILSNRP